MARNISREFFQMGSQAIQGIRDQAAKSDSAIKSINESAACASSCSSQQAKRTSGASHLDLRSYKVIAKGRNDNKLKQAEESLRTVLYLSCWGPN